MAAAKITRKALMAMKEDKLIEFATKNGYMAELSAIADRTVEHKKYPKVQKPMKQTKKNREDGTYDASKMTWQADKTKKPIIEYKPITFFEVKAAFADEVLKLPKVPEKKKEPTFRDRIAAAANNA